MNSFRKLYKLFDYHSWFYILNCYYIKYQIKPHLGEPNFGYADMHNNPNFIKSHTPNPKILNCKPK